MHGHIRPLPLHLVCPCMLAWQEFYKDHSSPPKFVEIPEVAKNIDTDSLKKALYKLYRHFQHIQEF